MRLRIGNPPMTIRQALAALADRKEFTRMERWPWAVKPTPTHLIRDAVSDPAWQIFRRAMKGISTYDKLRMLENWRWARAAGTGSVPEKAQIQIDNYINALRRGGLLDRYYSVIG